MPASTSSRCSARPIRARRPSVTRSSAPSCSTFVTRPPPTAAAGLAAMSSTSSSTVGSPVAAISSTAPCRMTRPRSTIAIWSHVFSTSSSRWDDRKTVRPSSTNARIRWRVSRMPGRVEPVHRLVEDQQRGVGEQAPCDAEPLAHAERVRLDAIVRTVRQADASERVVDAASAARSRAAATIFRFSRPVRWPWKRGSSTIAPTRARASRRFAGCGRPSRLTSPDVARVRPTSVRISVVLPAPFGPRKPNADARGHDQVDVRRPRRGRRTSSSAPASR